MTSVRSAWISSMVPPTISFAIVHVFVHFELHAHSLNSDDMRRLFVERERKWCEKDSEEDNRKENFGPSQKFDLARALTSFTRSEEKFARRACKLWNSKLKSRRAKGIERFKNCEFSAAKSRSWIIVAWFARHATNLLLQKATARFSRFGNEEEIRIAREERQRGWESERGRGDGEFTGKNGENGWFGYGALLEIMTWKKEAPSRRMKIVLETEREGGRKQRMMSRGRRRGRNEKTSEKRCALPFFLSGDFSGPGIHVFFAYVHRTPRRCSQESRGSGTQT